MSGPPMGSLALRPGDSLTIPRMALSVGFRTFGFPPVCDSSYRAPDSCPGGTGSRWMRQPSAGRTLLSKFVQRRCLAFRVAGGQLLRRLAPDVAVVKTTHTRQAGDSGVRRRPSLSRPTCRCILQLRVNALGVVVGDIVVEQAPQMLLAEHDHVSLRPPPRRPRLDHEGAGLRVTCRFFATRSQKPSSMRWGCPGCSLGSTLNQPNRRVRTRMHGGVGGREPRGSPLSRSRPCS